MAIDGVNGPVNTGRRRFLTATTAVVGAVGAGIAAVPFIKSWNPSARAKLAGAPVTADISGLQEGQRLILEWRGQPIWIVKRSQAVLQALPTLDEYLRDPDSANPDQQPEYVREANPKLRSLKPEISVLVGVLGQRVAQVAVQGRQRFQDRLGALDDPDRLAAPLEAQALPFLQGADVGHHRGAGQAGPGAGVPRLDERHCGETDADGTHRNGGGGQEPASTRVGGLVDLIVGHPALRKSSAGSVGCLHPYPCADQDADAKDGEV